MPDRYDDYLESLRQQIAEPRTDILPLLDLTYDMAKGFTASLNPDHRWNQSAMLVNFPRSDIDIGQVLDFVWTHTSLKTTMSVASRYNRLAGRCSIVLLYSQPDKPILTWETQIAFADEAAICKVLSDVCSRLWTDKGNVQ